MIFIFIQRLHIFSFFSQTTTRKPKGEIMLKDSLLNSFRTDVKDSNADSFPLYVDSFTNLWDYEFGSLDNLPHDVDELVADRAIEYGLME
jgi:hypothetical protein